LLTCRAVKLAAILVSLAAVSTARPVDLDPAAARAEDFFGLTKLHNFHVTIAPEDFRRMPPAGEPGVYSEVPATLQFEDRNWGAITVRYKGNSSYRYAPSELKRSLKLDLDSDSGRTFFGMSELNLNNNAFDPSQMREALAYDVFRRAGVAAPRTAFARVFLTVPGTYARTYLGLFTVVEQVDQAFFESRWRRPVGLLAKPEGLAAMPFLGDDWTRYEEPYGSRTTPSAGDAERFIAFVKLLNQASDEEFARRVGDYLDVDGFLRFLACEVVLVNTDSPLAMDHNYWLTIHPGTRKVVWVPWDMNMAFAGFKPSDADLSLHEPAVAGRFPLAERMLANRPMLARYDEIVREIVATNFTVARIDREMAAIQSVTGRAAAAEPQAVVSKAPPLRQFVVERVQSVTGQLEGKRRGIPGRAPMAAQQASE